MYGVSEVGGHAALTTETIRIIFHGMNGVAFDKTDYLSENFVFITLNIKFLLCLIGFASILGSLGSRSLVQ